MVRFMLLRSSGIYAVQENITVIIVEGELPYI
jgi:hypothetical protein